MANRSGVQAATDNLFETRPMLRESKHQKQYLRAYPVEMRARMERVGFRFLAYQEGDTWRCGWLDPLDEGFVCERVHATEADCLDGKCIWRIYQTFKFKVAARAGAPPPSRGRKGRPWRYLSRVFAPEGPEPESHLGLVILPPGVSRRAWPAASFDKRRPDAADYWRGLEPRD